MFYNVMYARLETDTAYLSGKVSVCKKRKENNQNLMEFDPTDHSFASRIDPGDSVFVYPDLYINCLISLFW